MLLAIIPILKAVAVAAVPVIAGWVGKTIVSYLDHSKYKSYAALAVHFVEDQFSGVEGQEKFKQAAIKLNQLTKNKLSQAELEALVASAYQSLIKPLDQLKNQPAA